MRLKAPREAKKTYQEWKAQKSDEQPQRDSSRQIEGDQSQFNPYNGHIDNAERNSDLDLPPQFLTISEPQMESTKQGKLLRITCKLQKSYPNFHIQSQYQFLEDWQDNIRGKRVIRYAVVAIWTRENFWTVSLEQEGFHVNTLKETLGEEGYSRWEKESQGRGPLRGRRLPYGPVGREAKKSGYRKALVLKSRGANREVFTICRLPFHRRGFAERCVERAGDSEGTKHVYLSADYTMSVAIVSARLNIVDILNRTIGPSNSPCS